VRLRRWARVSTRRRWDRRPRVARRRTSGGGIAGGRRSGRTRPRTSAPAAAATQGRGQHSGGPASAQEIAQRFPATIGEVELILSLQKPR
jgi:hypothetical protein